MGYQLFIRKKFLFLPRFKKKIKPESSLAKKGLEKEIKKVKSLIDLGNYHACLDEYQNLRKLFRSFCNELSKSDKVRYEKRIVSLYSKIKKIKPVTPVNRKGQMFIIMAFVICFLLFGVMYEYNTVQETVALQDFEELTENYKTESDKVYNKAVYEGRDPNELAGEFTHKFAAFAKDIDPNFGILYIVRDLEGDLILKNMLNQELIRIKSNLISEDQTIILESEDLNTPGTISIEGLGSMTVNAHVAQFDPDSGEIHLDPDTNEIIIEICGNPIFIRPVDFENFYYIVKSTNEDCQDPCDPSCITDVAFSR